MYFYTLLLANFNQKNILIMNVTLKTATTTTVALEKTPNQNISLTSKKTPVQQYNGDNLIPSPKFSINNKPRIYTDGTLIINANIRLPEENAIASDLTVYNAGPTNFYIGYNSNEARPNNFYDHTVTIKISDNKLVGGTPITVSMIDGDISGLLERSGDPITSRGTETTVQSGDDES